MILGITVVLLLALVPSTLAATVRIPTSAADWATFTTQEQQAAYNHEAAVFARQKASKAVTVHTVGASAVLVTSSGPASVVSAAAAVTAVKNCGFNYVNLADGTWTSAWATTGASKAMWVDTGYKSNQWNKFFRANTQLDTFRAANSSATYVFASSDTNFKWWFEQVRYTVQSWHTAGTTYNGPYYLGPLAFCTHNFSP
jgi:hypothetical protein